VKIKELGILLIRFFALWMLFQGIFALEQLVLNVMSPYDDMSMKRYLSVNYFSQFMTYLVLCIVLLSKTDKIVELILRPYSNGSTESHIEKQEVAILSFGLAGLFFFMDGAKILFYQFLGWFFLPKDDFATNIVKYELDKSALIVGIFSLSVGIFLIATPTGFLKSLKWFRNLGQNSSDITSRCS